MSKIKILVVPSDKTAVGNFRSLKPHMYLESKYPDEFFIDIDYSPDFNDIDYLKQYDIVHYHKKLGSYAETAKNVKQLNKMGIVTVMDIDDYWLPSKSHPMYDMVIRQDSHNLVRDNIKSATNITTTTSLFAEEISKFNKNVTVLPNGIDPKEKQYTAVTQESDRIRIGWLGGSSHKSDLELLKGVVSKLKSEKLLDKVQFVLCGFDLSGQASYLNRQTGQMESRPIHPMESAWYQYEKIFTDNYKSVSDEHKKHLIKYVDEEYGDVANEPYRRVWTKPIHSYANNYSLFDISLAPLEENTFNKMKSQLKAIESGFYKKPIIAQDFGPYQLDLNNAYEKGGNINSDSNAFLVSSKHNHKDWTKYIKIMVQNPELIKELGNNLYNTISNKYSMDIISEDRRKLYQTLVDNKKK